MGDERMRAMFNGLLRAAAIFVACVVGAAVGNAADIRIDPSRPAGREAILEGRIETGDFDKFKNFILDSDHAVELYLASPGGNLAEAMKIGLLVRILKLSTVVPSKTWTNQERETIAVRHNLKDAKADYQCTSACFFIFAAGVHRSSDDGGPAILGIHKPILLPETLKKLSFTQAAAIDDRTRTSVENYLKVMDVPQKYIENMYDVPNRKIRWIRNDEFNADFAGFIPELKDWVAARCDNRGDAGKPGEKSEYNAAAGRTTAARSAGDTLVKKSAAQLNCEQKAQDELAHRAYSDAQKRRSGEIPQSMLDKIPSSSPK